MATVAAVFTRQPWVRTPAQVIESLFPSRTKEESALLTAPPRPENKRVWASLSKGKAAVIEAVSAGTQRRDPDAVKTRLALTDGERALQTLVDHKLAVILILDLMHGWISSGKRPPSFTPKAVWQPAGKLRNAYFPAGSVFVLVPGMET